MESPESGDNVPPEMAAIGDNVSASGDIVSLEMAVIGDNVSASGDIVSSEMVVSGDNVTISGDIVPLRISAFLCFRRCFLLRRAAPVSCLIKSGACKNSYWLPHTLI